MNTQKVILFCAFFLIASYALSTFFDSSIDQPLVEDDPIVDARAPEETVDTTLQEENVETLGPVSGTSFIINGELEERIEGRSYMPVGWDGYGTIGRSTGYRGDCTQLYASSRYESYIEQELILNEAQVVLSFWIKPVPSTESVHLQVFFDDNLIFDETFTESSEWTPISREISTHTGRHMLKFTVPADKEYELGEGPYVEIDEISMTTIH